MKCYIYKIINNLTGEKYVGQTTNFSRRITDHKQQLNSGKHKNPKLQASWNKYGEENFSIIKQQYNLSKEELDQKEIEEIKKEDSYNNGFNLTLGGDGGNTRGNLTFEQFCFVYFGNKKYNWLCSRTGRYLNIDSSIVSSIAREKSYRWFLEKALLLSENEKQQYILKFEEELNVKENPPKPIKQKLTQTQINQFLSVVSVYGRGAEAAMTRYLGISKGLKNHLVNGSYPNEVTNFKKLSLAEIEQIATTLFDEENLQQYCNQKINKNKEIILAV